MQIKRSNSSNRLDHDLWRKETSKHTVRIQTDHLKVEITSCIVVYAVKKFIRFKSRELFHAIIALNLSVISTDQPTYWPSDKNRIPDLLDFVVTEGISKQCYNLINKYVYLQTEL